MENLRTTQEPAQNPEHQSLGAFKTSTALFHLFEAAESNLSKPELELMERARFFAQQQAENLAVIVEGLGLLLNDDSQDDWDWQSKFPTLLFQIGYELDAIAGLIELGDSARCRLNDNSENQV